MTGRDRWLPVRLAVPLGFAASWVVAAVLYGGWLWLINLAGSEIACSGPGDSQFGTLSWSIVPLGPVCEWADGTSSITTGPDAVYVVVDVVLVVGLVAVVASAVHGLVHLRRATRAG